MKSSGTLYWYGMSSDALDETDSAGNTNNSSFKEYVLFDGKRIARRDYQNNVNYYFADHLGTSRVVTNPSGTLLDDSDFYPFGGERPACEPNGAPGCTFPPGSGNHYKFTGKERDSESGLDNFGARFDSPVMGRFMSPDPLLSSARVSNPQSWNRFTYVLNNPLRLTDPTGMWDWDDSAGGTASDDDLIRTECNGKLPRKVRSKARIALEFRQRFRAALAAVPFTDDTMPIAIQDKLLAAVGAYGNESDSNGVSVGFEPGHGGATGINNDDTISVKFGSSLGGDTLTETVAHEGVHLVDDIAWLRAGEPEGGLLDKSFGQMEDAAWFVGSHVAQALGMKDLHPYNGGKELDVWNKGWKAAEIEERRKSGIRNVLAYYDQKYAGYTDDTISKEHHQ